eukprot:c20278_g1_i2.p1 GENE.c20278_g1_i2~~c20278_g1_i2.p1  ORF type:complete len:452 (+),score=213.21 c20278_g1_i2:53-1408(+)
MRSFISSHSFALNTFHFLGNNLNYQVPKHFSSGYNFATRRFLSTNYIVDVFTGDYRGAGTEARAKINLHGTKSELGETALVPKSGYFERASRERFVLTSPVDIGDLKEITVGHDEGGIGSGWYIERVEVNLGGKRFFFTCNRWLGQSDSGGISGDAVIRLSLTRAAEVQEEDEKKEIEENTKLVFKTSSVCLGHPERKISKAINTKHFGSAGEDAYRISESLITVADGVYQWKEKGIDAGEFARGLTSSIMDEGKKYPESSPKTLIEYGYKDVLSKNVKGSCTIVVCKLDFEESTLYSAFLGDSGFLIVRGIQKNNPKIVFRSQQQEHLFGLPYQLGHHENSDKPQDALEFSHSIKEHDIIVIGTDGLFDNLSDGDIVKCLQKFATQKGVSLQSAAQNIAFTAFAKSMDPKAVTPYSIAATEEFNMVFEGGKQDDITVIVAEIIRHKIEND